MATFLRTLTLLFGSAIGCFSPGAVAFGQGHQRWDFESQEPSWRDFGGDARYRIDLQRRAPGAVQTGQWVEEIRLTADNGSFVYLRQDVGQAKVIDELRITLWVKGSRPGLQLLARLTLPRTVDSRTGQPKTMLLRGGSTLTSGSWEQLKLDNLPLLMERQATVLRTQLGPQVDTREAYLDSVILNAYGGPGVTQLLIDDLEVSGFIGERSDPKPSGVNPAGWSAPGAARPAAEASPPGAALQGSVLTAGGRPIFPRIIEHRGEGLAFLKGLGFNVAKLPSFPSRAVFEEALAQGMWLVCPPPGETTPAPDANSPAWGLILAWDVGEGLGAPELEAVRAHCERLKRLDKRLLRPITGDVDSELRSYSRHVDLLRASRFPVGTSLELADYGSWLRVRPQLARPGTTLWTSVQTQPTAAIVEQCRWLSPENPPPATVDADQLRLLTYTAIAGGARGLCFQSASRLDGDDPPTRTRAAALELLNLEMDLIEPFCAGGTFVASVPGSDPEVAAALLQTDRARLLVPVWNGFRAQFAPGQSAGNGVTFTAPGVPDACDALEITPAGLRSPRHKRGLGGMRVTLDEFGVTSLVLISQDPLAVSSLTRKLERIKKRSASLQRELAALRLQEVEGIDRALSSFGSSVRESPSLLRTAKAGLAECDRLLAAGDDPAAYQQAQRALRPLRMLARMHWDKAVNEIGSPVACAQTASFSTLPQHYGFLSAMRGAEIGVNLLPAGDFEQLDRLLQNGWRHVERSPPEIETEAQLAPTSPHTGQACLLLRAWAVDAKTAPALVESPPIWIHSAPVQLEAGQLVRLHGWVNVPAAIQGSWDGLMIVDSLAGPAMAERIGQTPGWREFTLYRVAPQAGPMTVTFALTGLGSAMVDDVTIEPLTPKR